MCLWYFEPTQWTDSDGNDIIEIVCASPRCGASYEIDKIDSLKEHDADD